MKKTLSILLLSAAFLAGCGSSNDDFTTSTDNGGAQNGFQSRSVIPMGGGAVPIPQGTGFTGNIMFDPGAAAGTEITLGSSLKAPNGVTLPTADLGSGKVTRSRYFYLSFSVNKPTPISLIEGMRLQGDGLPVDHEHYHARLYQVGGVAAKGEVSAQQSAATFLQAIPGDRDASGATFDEINDGATLEPGVGYVAEFGSDDQQLLTFKLVNNSGISPCYVFIKGENPDVNAHDNRFYYVSADGQLKPMDVDDMKNGSADYNILLPDNGIIKLPLALSGRLYISLGEKIKTQMVKDPNDGHALWVAPNGWSNSNDPNYKTLFDFVEFDYKVSPDSKLPGMGVNTTQVQMVGIPTILELGNTGTTPPRHEISGADGDGTRSKLMKALGDDPAFKTLIVTGTATNTNVSPIRAVSLDNGIRSGRDNVPDVPHFLPTTFYDAYITQVWEKYKLEDLTAKTSAFGTFIGRVNAQDQMIFTQQGKRTVVVPRPETNDVIIGDGKLLADLPNAKTDEEKAVVTEIASMFSACFNRTTLLVLNQLIRNPTDFDSKNFALFYQNAPTNLYSKLNHELSLPTAQAPLGGAYGFGYDDNLNQSSVIIDNDAPTSMTITIPAF